VNSTLLVTLLERHDFALLPSGRLDP